MTCPINGKPCVKYKGFQVTEKVGEKAQTHTVCEDCLYLSSTKNIQVMDDDETCSSCGTALSDILRGKRIGCASCYDQFNRTMGHIIDALQGGFDLRHKGDPPYLWKIEHAEKTDPSTFASELSRAIEAAMDWEMYERVPALKEKLDAFRALVKKYESADEQQAPSVRREIAEFVFDYREWITGLEPRISS
jgi:protein-arginine kinase activator protein McsA